MPIKSRLPFGEMPADPPAAVRLDSVTFGYGTRPVVREVSLTIPAGRFVTLLGPSGCGKTTLLRLIGGYLTPQCGRIELSGEDAASRPSEVRNVGMVFQSYALFPHLSVRRNVAFGLEVRRRPKQEIRQEVDHVLDRVDLAPELRDRFPEELSGGQQQRVALARALAFQPEVLLLDEPLCSLDRHLREQMRLELRRIHDASGTATLMVTHDQEEALAMSDLVGIMRDGRLLQFGNPREVYENPQTPFVARFLGDANLLDGVHFGKPPGTVMMIRPEFVERGDRWRGRVQRVAFLGADVIADIECSRFNLRIRTRPDQDLTVGSTVGLEFPAEKLREIPGRDVP